MALNDAIHNGQSDSRAFEIGDLLHALERREQFGCVAHVETGPVVLYKIHWLALPMQDAKF